MLSITIVRTTSFSIYSKAKHIYSEWLQKNLGVDVLGHVNSKGSYPSLWTMATFGAAGATAGSCITVIACPFELSKLSAQVSVLLSKEGNCSEKSQEIARSYQNKGTFRTMKNIVKHRGLTGLYTGFRMHLCKCCPLYQGYRFGPNELTLRNSARHSWYCSLLYHIRELQTTLDHGRR